MKSDTPLILSLLCFALGQGERAVSFLSFARVEGGGPRPLSLSLSRTGSTDTHSRCEPGVVCGKSSQKESNAGSRTHCKLHAVPLLSFAESAEVLDPDRPPCQQILKHGPAEAGIRSTGLALAATAWLHQGSKECAQDLQTNASRRAWL